MAQFTRRAFTAMMAGAPLAAAAQEPLPHRRLGRINFQTSILGFGAQHLGDNGVEQSLVDRTIAEAIDSGVNYVDTAPTYEASEIRVGYALKGKRDKVFLVSKVEILSRPDVLYQVKESLRKLQTDHLDCVHLHNVGRMERWPDMEFVLKHEEGALAGLIEAKKQGLIGHIGCSTHMRVTRVLPAFAIDHIELFMCPINFVDRHIYNFEEKVLPEARKNNIGIIAMKALGGPVKPASAQISDARDYPMAMRYAWGVPGVAVVNLGMRNPDELRIALAAARSYKPFEASELPAVTARGKELAAKWGGPIRGPIA
jgi:predicted aldo/keto reductase-like oxidoreductase